MRQLPWISPWNLNAIVCPIKKETKKHTQRRRTEIGNAEIRARNAFFLDSGGNEALSTP